MHTLKCPAVQGTLVCNTLIYLWLVLHTYCHSSMPYQHHCL
jgi:hypothetical protein